MKRHNIVLISIDTLRADHLSCYGYGKATSPCIDALAGDGTVFRRSYSTGVWTPPGHASMLTGLYVHQHGVFSENRLADDVPTVATVLKNEGYQTAGFVNNSQVGALVGLDKGHDVFEEIWKGVRPASPIDRCIRGAARLLKKRLWHEDAGAARTNGRVRDWLGGLDAARPFYLFLHYIEPHNPLNPPAGLRRKYARGVDWKRVSKEKIARIAHNPLVCFVEDLRPNAEEIAAVKALYDGEIEYTDSMVGEVVAMLTERDLYKDALVIVTSDHGEHFGEHGLWSHAASLFKEVLHVPLVVKFPEGFERAEAVDQYTQLVDILPTIQDVAGVRPDRCVDSPGHSLVHTGRNVFHDRVFAQWEGRIPYYVQSRLTQDNSGSVGARFTNGMCMVADDRHKYIEMSDGSGMLFEAGSGETENLASAGKETVMEMKGALGAWRAAGRKAKAEERRMDDAIRQNLESLGYM